jgi:hypothetical protein
MVYLMDAQIRFFEMMIKVFLVYTLVTWPILLPIDAVGMPITQSDGLGRLGFGKCVTGLLLDPYVRD